MATTFPKPTLDGIVARLQAGESSIGKEALALGMSYRTSLIGALRAHMGRAAYDVMVATRRPKTGGGGRTVADRPRPDDKALSIVKSMRKSDGWSWRYVAEHEQRIVRVEMKDARGQKGYVPVKDTGERILIMIDPHGVEYVRADEFEKADLLRTNVMQESGPLMRFVRYEHSAMRKRVERSHERGAAVLEQGEAALDRKRAKANKKAEVPEPQPEPTPAAPKKKAKKAKTKKAAKKKSTK